MFTLSSPQSTKHVPERSCVACRRKGPQAEFVRLRKTETGWEVSQGQREGRGAYVCKDNSACHTEKRLRRALGASAASVANALSSGTFMNTI
ncbi:YlxR family protein [Deinococcus yavapaiensis]|uniref:YlxR family protein n=1 Tax=Deinococcus yavapaiensis TaxID=309889 RepID=UPI001FE323B7|nr:YlxR family protein [Deinococcus yavapaiensis]